MKKALESEDTVLRLWTLLHRVRDALVLCEDSIFSEYGITMEQFSLLGAVKGWGGSLRPSELAAILERSPNSISMLVDRMVKAGLAKRTRDRKDRRVVNVSLTSKGEDALRPAVPAGWEFIHRILSPLSDEDMRALTSLLERIKCELLGYLNPEADMAEIMKNSVTNQPDFYQRVAKNVLPPSSPPRHQLAKKRRPGSQGRNCRVGDTPPGSSID